MKYILKITLLILTCSVNAGKKSDKLIGNITKQHAKDFAAGLSIGIAHGLINNTFAEKVNEPAILEMFTFVAANGLETTYHDNNNCPNAASKWGHGIGQCVSESVNLDDGTIKPRLSLNLTLLYALIASL